jgi:hypothetical protein
MEDNPFEINQSDAFVTEAGLKAELGDADLQAQALIDELEDEEEHNVEDLIPLCVKHQKGPAMNTAVYGYDIQQMEDRPWAKPGANLAQYFNYGFNEQSWRAYCAMHPKGKDSVLLKAEEFLEQETSTAAATRQRAEPTSTAGAAQEETHPTGWGDYSSAGYQNAHHRPNNYVPVGQLYKTKPCYAFREGRCFKGENCQYAHGEHELRPAPQPQNPSSAPGFGHGEPHSLMNSHSAPVPTAAPVAPVPPPPGSNSFFPMPSMQPLLPTPNMPPLGASVAALPIPSGSGGFRMPAPRQPHGGAPGSVLGNTNDALDSLFEGPEAKKARLV